MKPSLHNATLEAPACIDSVDDLARLQRLMGATLYRELTLNDELKDPWMDGRAMSTVVETFITPNDRLTSYERLQIYSQSYWYRVLDCLYDDYPALRTLLGQKKFMALIQAYLAQYPSESWTLRNLGGRMVKFIQANAALTKPFTDMAVDVARLEWAQTLAFDEERKKPVQGDNLLGQPADTLRLGVQPYVVLLDLNCTANDFVSAAKKNEVGLRSETSNTHESAPTRAAVKRVSKPKPAKVWMAVHRCDNMLYFKTLQRESFLLLTAFREGKTLTEAVDVALADADPSVNWADKLREWFTNWGELGWFCKP